MEKAEEVTNIHFPKSANQSNLTALFEGRLEIKKQRIGFTRMNGCFTTFIGWPDDFDLVKIEGVVYIVNNNKSKVVAAIGDYVEAGGGMFNDKGKGCLPSYWKIGDFSKLSFIDSLFVRHKLSKRQKTWDKFKVQQDPPYY